MQNNPYQHMAKEFMDLWQKQIAAVISDKQFIQAMLEMFQNAQNIPPNAAYDKRPHAANTAHATAADDGMLAELAFRVAMCEKRLAALERPARKPAKKSAAGSKRKAGSSIRGGAAGRSSKPRR